MIMKCIKSIVALLVCLWSASVWASPNALYFMDILPYKAYQNPAFRPLSNSYVELPGLSTISVSTGLGGLSLNDVIYVKDGQLVTFLHPEYGNKNALFNKLKPVNSMDLTTDISLLGFGFKVKEKGYFTFNASARVDVLANYPKDLVALAFYGTPDFDGINRYDLGSIYANVRAYLDVSGGYSHRINEKWSVGGRLHVLLGVGAAQLQFDELCLEASKDAWNLQGKGKANISFPGLTMKNNPDGSIAFEMAQGKDILSAYRPSMGAAIDLGVEYKPIPELSVSLALKDIGFMYWNNLNTAVAQVDGSYTGMYFETGAQINVVDSLASVIAGSFVADNAKKGYVQEMTGKLYVGAEYSFLRNMMSVGVLSRTEFMSHYISEEISLNYKLRPCHWFGISAGYSFFSGGWSTIGFAMDLKLPPFNFYVATDYTPLYYSKQGIPYKSQGFNVQTGIVLTFKTKANAKRLMSKVEIPVDSTKMANDTIAAMEALAIPSDTLMVLDSIPAAVVDSAVVVADSLAMAIDSISQAALTELPQIAPVEETTQAVVDSAQSIQEQWEALVAETGQDVSYSTQVVTETVTTKQVDAGELSGTDVVKMKDGKKEE